MALLYPISPPKIDLPKFADDLKRVLDSSDAGLFQLRLKDVSEDEILKAAEKLIPICHAHQVLFLMNDSAALAKKSGADGVHLGEDDDNVAEAREILGSKIIGVSCYNSLDRAKEMAALGVDYVSFGAFYPTTTKTPKSKAEISTLQEWKKISDVPVSVIGGINFENMKPLVDAGADYICMISAVWR